MEEGLAAGLQEIISEYYVKGKAFADRVKRHQTKYDSTNLWDRINNPIIPDEPQHNQAALEDGHHCDHAHDHEHDDEQHGHEGEEEKKDL